MQPLMKKGNDTAKGRSTLVPQQSASGDDVAPGGMDINTTRFFRTIWKWVVAASMVSAGVAAYWAERSRSVSYESETRLIFNKTSVGWPLYQSPDARSLAVELTSLECAEELRQQRGLKMPAAAISRSLKLSLNRGNSLVDLKLQWADREDGMEILDAIADIGVRRVCDIRDKRIDQFIASTEDVIRATYHPALAAMEQERDVLRVEFGVPDVEERRLELVAELEKLNQFLVSEQVKEQTLHERKQMLSGGAMTLVSNSTAIQTDVSPTPPSDSDMVRRIAKLQSDIATERSDAITLASLRQKEKELQRLDVLRQKNLITASRYETTEAEVERLRILTYGNEPIQDLEHEVNQLMKRFRDADLDPDLALESMQALEEQRAELNLELRAAGIRIERFQEMIESTKQELEDLKPALEPWLEVQQRIEMTNEMILEKTELIEGLMSVKGTDANAFTVVGEARPSASPESSDFRKKFAAAFMLCLLSLSAPIAGLGLRSSLPTTSESLANRVPSPQIGTVTVAELDSHADTQSQPESVRLISVRLLQLLAEAEEALVHFIGLSDRDSTVKLVLALGDCLAAHGRDVTVVVAGDTARIPLPSDNVDGLRPRASVVHLPSVMGEDILSGFGDLDDQSGIVLLTGLSTDNQSAIELLSMKSTGVVLSAFPGDSLPADALDVVDNLVAFQTPVMGYIA